MSGCRSFLLKRALLGVEFEGPVDGLGLLAGRLGQPLGGAARGRGQQDIPAPAVENGRHGPDDRRLPRARPAR